MQRYNWGNTFNTRDLGYTPTVTGKYIKFQRFIRSDAPCKIEDGVKDFLVEKNVKTVIEFGCKFNAGQAYIKCVSLHSFICSKIGTKLSANSVRVYSTLGGIS